MSESGGCFLIAAVRLVGPRCAGSFREFLVDVGRVAVLADIDLPGREFLRVDHADSPRFGTRRLRPLIGALPLPPATSAGREIRLVEEDDGRWSAIGEGTGVAGHGDTREEALEMLDGAGAPRGRGR